MTTEKIDYLAKIKNTLISLKSDTLLGVIIISLLGWYMHGITNDERYQQEVTQRCVAMRDNLVQVIDSCLVGNAENLAVQVKTRYELRNDLLKPLITHGSSIDPSVYFSVIKLTRFESSEYVYNLCSLDKGELSKFRDILITYCYF